MTRHTLRLTVAAAALFAAGTAMAETTLRFSDYGPNRGARAAALEWFANELETRSDGELKIEFFWGGSLLGGRDTLGGVGSGVADMGTVVGFFTPKELQLYNIGDLPVDNSDIWVGMRAMYELSGTNEAMTKEFSDAGVHYLTNYSTGPVQLICRDEVKTLADLDGKKIRASGPYGDTLEKLGVEIVRMSQADVYQALDSGLIDCNQNYYYAMQAYKQYEVAPYALELDWGQNMSFGIVVNEATYEGLPDDQKQVLDEVASDFIDHLAAVIEDDSSTSKTAMEKGVDGKSLTVNTLDQADREKLLDASQAAIDEWVTRTGGAGEPVLAEYRDLIEKYRKEEGN